MKNTEFVDVWEYVPGIEVELRYATENNFTGRVIYDFEEARLRYGTVKKLAKAQLALEAMGYGLKVWDAYRPVAAQFKLWETVQNPAFVADPTTGFSNHSRGNTVDVTLVNELGLELKMPTGFDDFTPAAGRGYEGVDEEAVENAKLLERVMLDAGFRSINSEWWHFVDTDEYPVSESEN